MKLRTSIAILTLWLSASGFAAGAIRYVDGNSPNPSPPYDSWSTAATNIQDAVDAAVAGDQVLVTNGVYQTGGRAVDSGGTTTNRVAVTKAVTIQSVNGPSVTIIRGHQVPGTTNGVAAIRCVYLTSGSSLSGFALANGATTADDLGGGVLSELPPSVVTNCVLTGNYAGYGGGAARATLHNCVVTANAADIDGGGTVACILINCVVAGNSVGAGGGTGGGAAGGMLSHCSLLTNSALFGGGAYSATLNNCRLFGNTALSGGGADECTLNNCLLSGNSAYNAGAVSTCVLNNCTVARNSASDGVGGADNSTLVNCIAYYNVGPGGIIANYEELLSTVDYSCTMPMPMHGVGNITNAPLFIDLSGGNLHLQLDSPCIDAGTNLSGVVTDDLDGRPRPIDGNADGVAAFDMGAYEHTVLFVRQNNSDPAQPYTSWLTAATNIQDAADLTLAGAGDQILVTNGVYQFGGNASGRVALTNALTSLQSVNGPQATVIDGDHAVQCVFLGNATVLSGFTVTNGLGGGVVFDSLIPHAVVTNCVITRCSGKGAVGSGSTPGFGTTLTDCTLLGNAGGASGCYLKNCLLINNTNSTDGGGAVSCVLERCTLTGNVARRGGGAYLGVLTNCTLASNLSLALLSPERSWGGGGASHATLDHCRLESNRALNQGGGAYGCQLYYCALTENRAEAGGGAAYGGLYNCLLTANFAATRGGGAYYADALKSCTIVGNSNSATNVYGGGGTYGGRLHNCIVYYNNYPDCENCADVNHCCTGFWPGLCPWPWSPGVADANGNIIDTPEFVDTNGWSNLRLSGRSYCINAGSGTVYGATDLDGRPRIVAGRVDIGAYEWVEPFNYWLRQYGLATDGSADFIDSDNDGLNNYQESVTGTDPTNSISVLQMLSPTTDLSSVVVRWQSVSNRTYFVERASSLAGPTPFSRISSNIPGQAGTTSYTDTNAPGPFFYRVGVQP